MSKNKKKKNKAKEQKGFEQTKENHPLFCMIRPNQEDGDEDIASTGQS